MSPARYKSVGVDVAAGERLIQRIGPTVRSTFSRCVLTNIGAFGALFSAKFSEHQHPVLVSSIDGGGTKLKVAFLLDRHDTVGQDLVNHCESDVLVCRASPFVLLGLFRDGQVTT